MADKKKTNQYGTDNIYLDAAIDALKQVASEKDIDFVLMFNNGKKIGLTHNVDKYTLSKLLAQCAQNEMVHYAIIRAHAGIQIYEHDPDEFLSEFVDKMEKFNKELGELGKKYGIEQSEEE